MNSTMMQLQKSFKLECLEKNVQRWEYLSKEAENSENNGLKAIVNFGKLYAEMRMAMQVHSDAGNLGAYNFDEKLESAKENAARLNSCTIVTHCHYYVGGGDCYDYFLIDPANYLWVYYQDTQCGTATADWEAVKDFSAGRILIPPVEWLEEIVI